MITTNGSEQINFYDLKMKKQIAGVLHFNFQCQLQVKAFIDRNVGGKKHYNLLKMVKEILKVILQRHAPGWYLYSGQSIIALTRELFLPRHWTAL